MIRTSNTMLFHRPLPAEPEKPLHGRLEVCPGRRRASMGGMNRPSGSGKDLGGNTQVEERAERVARSLGARLIVGAVEAAVVSVPLTVLTALVISHSDPLHHLDQGIADSLHRYLLPRPTLSGALGLISVITHPNSVRLASAVLAGALWWQGHRRRAA